MPVSLVGGDFQDVVLLGPRIGLIVGMIWTEARIAVALPGEHPTMRDVLYCYDLGEPFVVGCDLVAALSLASSRSITSRLASAMAAVQAP